MMCFGQSEGNGVAEGAAIGRVGASLLLNRLAIAIDENRLHSGR